MAFQKNIHFRTTDAVLVLEVVPTADNDGNPYDELRALVSDVHTGDAMLESKAPYPRVLIHRANISDFWDLVREEILSVGTGKQDAHIKCLLLHKVQKELRTLTPSSTT